MTQEPFDFGLIHRCDDAHRQLVRALNDAVAQLGLLVAAGACGCDPADLRKALDGDRGRYIRSTWPAKIASIAPAETRDRIARALVAGLGLDISPNRPRTAHERLAALQQRVAAELGSAGARIVDEEIRRG